MKLKLANPLKDFKITQYFGNKNPALYGTSGHNGLDCTAPHGTPVYASHDGFASYQVDGGGGHGVVIITDKEYEDVNGVSSYFKTLYWHLVDPLKEPKYKSPFADKTGFTTVKQGELIGYADNTGRSTGSHLHYGLKPVTKGESWGVWYSTDTGNGYFGAVDPYPYLDSYVDFPRYMKRGDFGEDIEKMQAFFLRNKYMSPIYFGFGNYGPLTQKAVKQFQINNNIPNNNGVQCGPLTIAKLTELIRDNK